MARFVSQSVPSFYLMEVLKMTETICAKVDPRLLTKADRLFTGSLDGRIIEILQNARRAGATTVRITNKDEKITVEDNGSGIEDFQKLLDLGGSGWDEMMETGEDPAGVGLFSLAPRKVIILSGDRKVSIEGDGWSGESVAVEMLDSSVNGTVLKFTDKPWDFETVQKHAAFCGMKVVVDGKVCRSVPFCSENAVAYDNPGCRVEVVDEISKYHNKWITGISSSKVLVNFHGQVVEFEYWPGSSGYLFRRSIKILVDLTDQTDIRLMLPARTRLVENEALKRLKQAIELEYFKYYQKQKEHSLYYSEFKRAKELGIDLPEATPKFRPGLLSDEQDMPVEVAMPKDYKLEHCYICTETKEEHDEANVHLLAALGKFDKDKFIPVTIDQGYLGYSWTDLPKVTEVEVKHGKELIRSSIQSGDLVCYESLSITVKTSNGKEFCSDVIMAMINEPPSANFKWYTDVAGVTKEARTELDTANIWYHLGGFSYDGDTYDTQEYYIQKDIDDFWNELIGPYETMRQKLISELYCVRGKWQKIVINEDHSLLIVFKDGKRETVNAPS